MSLILVRQEYGGRERPYVMRTNTSGGGHLLHYFCTIVVLLGFSVTFAALAGVRAYLASQDTRTPLVRDYNRAVDAWVKETKKKPAKRLVRAYAAGDAELVRIPPLAAAAAASHARVLARGESRSLPSLRRVRSRLRRASPLGESLLLLLRIDGQACSPAY